MNNVDIVFYIIDVILIVMLVMYVKNSQLVKLQSKVGSPLIISCVFYVIAVIGFIRYSGVFRYVQSIAIVIMGILYSFVKSGFYEKGIVTMGNKYDKAYIRNLSFNDTDCVVSFVYKNKKKFLYFKEDQVDEVKQFLKKWK